MADPKAAPIIVIKKKSGHGGHHGGAWKVAYADFVTAMMALFIVLWLLNTSQDVKDAIAGYFKDPEGSGRLAGSSQAGTGDALQLERDNIDQLKDKLEQMMKETPELADLKDHVQMTVTGEGLRVELLETEKGFFFDSGNPTPSKNGEEFLTKLAAEVGKMPNKVVIEGHTDAKPFGKRQDYSNWELSADRANSARRIMQGSGLKPDQVTQVRGFADQQLRNAEDPEDASNRRITVIIKYLLPKDAPDANKRSKSGKPEEGPHGSEHKPAATSDGHGGEHATPAKPSPTAEHKGH